MKLKKDSVVKSLLAKSFPHYKGRTFSLETCGTIAMSPYWEGGSRSQYVAINRVTGQSSPYKTTNIYRDKFALDSHTIPAELVIVEHTIFQGKDCGIRFYVAAGTALPA